ncbi:hypothetical protein BD310DRAFT_981478 [Dichomitus squalens]|uniref:Uncharacterized protein n=1 Tax=Dichomitus squalens TaxID=114155 RepID=A0A4V2K6N9_9APHY|nr:hypothetical protein BD310DRAFT_981478 [Dichomitus squalens]
MEVVVQDITAPIGSLAPRSRLSVLAVVTLGESTEVYRSEGYMSKLIRMFFSYTDTVCCENNSFGGLIAI